MPSGERETVTAREFVRPLTRHYICRSLAAEKFHQAVPDTKEGPGSDGRRRAGFQDAQLFGRARAEIHFGGPAIRMTEPERDFPDAGELTVRINAESMLRNLA